MGIHNWNPFAQAHGITGTKLDSTVTKTLTVEVDVLGMYHWQIISALHTQDVAAARPAPAFVPSPRDLVLYVTPQGYTGTPPPAKDNKTAHIINNRLLQHFNPNLTTLHIDGHRTKQKQKEHQRRDAEQQKRVTKCLAISGACHALASTGSRRRFKDVKKFWKVIKTCRPILDREKRSLVDDLRKLGWTVCHCTGEADVCIAKVAKAHNNRYAVSRDTDLFFHCIEHP